MRTLWVQNLTSSINRIETDIFIILFLIAYSPDYSKKFSFWKEAKSWIVSLFHLLFLLEQCPIHNIPVACTWGHPCKCGHPDTCWCSWSLGRFLGLGTTGNHHTHSLPIPICSKATPHSQGAEINRTEQGPTLLLGSSDTRVLGRALMPGPSWWRDFTGTSEHQQRASQTSPALFPWDKNLWMIWSKNMANVSFA